MGPQYSGSVESRLEANRANWDDRVAIHTMSEFYDVERWLKEGTGPRLREVDALGDVAGLSLVQLQCHFGMDALQWARAGATVTGVDFSAVAIEEARALAVRAGLQDRSTFVCANVYDAPEALAPATFDIVYVSLGSLCWLPDIEKWAGVVASLLSPSGRLYVHDVHPFSSCLDEDGERIIYSYFEDQDSPFVVDEETTYTDGGTLEHTRNYEWNHSISEMTSSLQDCGLTIDSFIEHDWTVFQQFSWLVRDSEEFSTPPGRPRIPLTFTLTAHAS